MGHFLWNKTFALKCDDWFSPYSTFEVLLKLDISSDTLSLSELYLIRFNKLLQLWFKYTRNRFRERPRPPSIFLNHLSFCNDFEELETVLINVKLIINNAPLT